MQSSRETPMIIDFCPEGRVEAMHREKILDLSFLGKQQITRATDIRFNEATQKWDIWLNVSGEYKEPCEYASGFDGYEAARAIEVEWLERCRLYDIRPETISGEYILELIRKNMQ